MISTLIDSNIVIDILTPGDPWAEWSVVAVAQVAAEGRALINPIVVAEVAIAFEREEEIEGSLPQSVYHREQFPWEAAFVAGRAHSAYRRRGGKRDRTLPDFLIGAHAAVKGYRLLTRDAGRYRAYFPDLDIIAPDTHP